MQRPNVLLLFTDMQRHDTVGALGNGTIRTPALDRLCREGTAFTQAYTPSPVCVSARCGLHYGLWPIKKGCVTNTPFPSCDGTTVQARLTKAGYRTHGIGKMHFAQDRELNGFQSRETQEEIVRDPKDDDYLQHLFAEGYDHITDPHGARGETYYIPQLAQMPARLHPSQWIGDRTLRFLDGEKGKSDPFFLMASFIHPHPPFAVPAPWHKLYRAGHMGLPYLPAEREHHLTWQNHVQNRYKWRDRGFDLNLLRCIRAYYYACISFVDFQIGRILDTLAANGQLDNTVIVFTSDHGEYLGDYGCFGKRSMHDASCRIPMIARHPGTFAAGARCDTPASLIDVAPTFLQAAGTGLDGLDGVALGDLAAGRSNRQAVFSQHGRGDIGEYAICTKAWKYFWSAADQQAFLYDKTRDPLEHERCGDRPFWNKDADRLRGDLIAWMKANGNASDLDGNGFATHPVKHISANLNDGLLIQDHPWADQHIPGYSD